MDLLQQSVVTKEAKRFLSEGIQISKEARESLQLSSTIFIHYITDAAMAIAKSQKKSTIQPAHIIQALLETGFESMVPEIEEVLREMESVQVQAQDQVQSKTDQTTE